MGSLWRILSTGLKGFDLHFKSKPLAAGGKPIKRLTQEQVWLTPEHSSGAVSGGNLISPLTGAFLFCLQTNKSDPLSGAIIPIWRVSSPRKADIPEAAPRFTKHTVQGRFLCSPPINTLR